MLEYATSGTGRIQVETLYTVVLIYIALELFEIGWQKAETLMKMMLKLYEKYQRSMLWFLLLHPTYYFAIWLAMATDYSIAALLMLFIKTVDIATKIKFWMESQDRTYVYWVERRGPGCYLQPEAC